MGPYCKFCGTRCFVPFPMQTPTEAIAAYRPGISIIATCREGQAAEKRDTGWCYDDIKDAIDAIPPRLCTHCGAVLNDPYSPDYCTHCYSWNESETPASETMATETITMECPNCGGLGIIRTFAVRWFDVPCDVCGGTGYGVEMPRETSETTAADAVAEMRECAVCGQVRADCVNQTPARETEVADINVCEDCRDALAELSF